VRFLRLAEREAQSEHGLTAAQLFVLHSLAESPAGSLAELAERTLTDQSSVSTVVARLVARRLLARKVSRADRRRAELRLTAAGARVVATKSPLPQPRIIAAIAAMPRRRRAALVSALESLVDAIGAGDVEPRMLFEDDAPPRRGR
jgi:MarR family transcriptional regulator, organic hydroperoxide resistance regulator